MIRVPRSRAASADWNLNPYGHGRTRPGHPRMSDGLRVVRKNLTGRSPRKRAARKAESLVGFSPGRLPRNPPEGIPEYFPGTLPMIGICRERECQQAGTRPK